MSTAPAFQFYPGDWLNDIKLQACSLAAQGLLINLMCLMHQSEKYGFLLINGSRPDDKLLIKLLKTHHRTFKALILELLFFGVIKQDEDGVLYCKRMVKDQEIRDIRRECGKLGGNPKLEKGKPNPYYLDKQKDNQKITPSSSSSSSSSNLLSSSNELDCQEGKKQPSCPQNEIIKIYHEILPELPKVRAWNEQSQSNLRSRWREHVERQDVEWWAELFRTIRGSDFLMGRKSDRFQASMTWIVKPSNFAKILNGNYENRRTQNDLGIPDDIMKTVREDLCKKNDSRLQ